MSEDSKKWLVACLDPYHDNQIEIEGLPDERTTPSVVQVHNQAVSLTIPASAAGGNWDASVLYTGISSLIAAPSGGGLVSVLSTGVHNYDSTAIVPGMPFGALDIWAGAAGSTMSTGAPLAVGDNYQALGSCLGTDRCRVIGVAFEVHNTTAEVYRQGSLTVAALPDVADDSGTVTYTEVNGAAGFVPTVKQSDRVCVQACTVAALQSVPGASTWPAAKGVYAIPRMAKVPRDVQHYALGTGVIAIGNGYAANTHVPILYGSDGKRAVPEPSSVYDAGVGIDTCATTMPFASAAFSPVQVMFSGLSPQTTLTITFRTIVEYFPAVGSSLLPLASPSPYFDPLAFEIYGALVQSAPYAVPVGMNAAGDYFRNVMKLLGTIGTAIGPALPGPYGLLATAGGALATQLSRLGAPVKREQAGAGARSAPARRPRK